MTLLNPHNRRLLIDALQPPPEYELDYAIGTTFSLDLLALLTAPLAFTWFGWQNSEEQVHPDPLVLLDGMRRYADRITIFCQAGQIKIPKQTQLLYSYLEKSVVEVKAKHPTGVFHPKVWILRFLASTEEPAKYRLLCLSRNLTFDRSWDTILVLDGTVTNQPDKTGMMKPLANFIAALPTLALRGVPEQAQAMVERMKDELHKVQFELPPNIDAIKFWPLGIEKKPNDPFMKPIDRMLVISPFVSSERLRQLAGNQKRNILVSRIESFTTLKQKDLRLWGKTYVLSPFAEPEESMVEDDNEYKAETLSGLHAKLYIADSGNRARIWTGSANATEAAFHNNVEFLVELIGTKSVCGVDAILKQERDTCFFDLLQSFDPKQLSTTVDLIQEELERQLEDVRHVLVGSGLVAQVIASEEQTLFAVRLEKTGKEVALPTNVTTRAWPITLKEAHAIAVNMNKHIVAIFERLSLEALTSFFAFELTTTKATKKATCRFVMNLPLQGAPEHRQEHLLRSLLKSRKDVLRYMLLLLADSRTNMHNIAHLVGVVEESSNHSGTHATTPHFPLLEVMLRALAQDPTKLDPIARLVDDLSTTPEGKALLPEGFESIWNPISLAQKNLNP